MSEIPEPVDQALARHDAFTATESGYTLDTTVFEAVVTASSAEGKRDGEFAVTVRLPTLDAAVTGETVHEVVEDGWFETLELRLEDTFDVATTSTHDPPQVTRTDDEVVVELSYIAWNASEGVEDAKTLVEFVEGTYAQGIVPGYEYRGAAAELMQSAVQNSENAVDGGGSSGGPPL
ncbi:DUF5813 family protein [Haloarchaeobius sp. HME9146]|uniref:DUF5813 family protein n=1 Tax=Haloarchaeobius sp. HME9146 TaxID=2978732 RepID=UPI0021BED74F|nr:DUF5813 family protein [Haloarchaeobius sp. HME9146]MCT9097845.1 DUF5813 family protein [Haloarchaeobius sp. HME9146]